MWWQVGAVRASVPFVIVCDGHGYVNLLNNVPGDTPVEHRNTLHVGGRQAADIASTVLAQYLDKYAEEFEVHSADRFFHKAFCLAHQVVIEQVRMGALTEADEGGLLRYKEARGAGGAPANAMDAAYFKQPISKWVAQVFPPQKKLRPPPPQKK
jgi:hypothetical protein